MRVLIFGGRDFVGNPTAEDWLTHNIPPNPTIISGTARGADKFGEEWATTYFYPIERFPADWKTHGRKAGYIRNQQMLDSGIDVAFQFPGGTGTADMRRRLDKAGVKVYVYEE